MLCLTYSGFHSADLTMAPDLNQIQPNTVGYANLPLEAQAVPELEPDQHARQRRVPRLP